MELLREGDDNLALKKLRQSAASYRIFKKHGWNKVESGWNGFF
jgi:thioester reductase-like protein